MSIQEGLVYYPSEYIPPIGYAGFEVRLTDRPGDRFFDARQVVFPVEQGGALRRLVAEHPGRLASPLRFVTGRIRLDAHDGDCIEIVTFGGQAEFSVEGNETVCRVTSSASFLPLDENPESPFVLMDEELEAIVARLRAGWGAKEPEHLDRLSRLDPMTVFRASIHSLEERLERLVRVEGDEPTRRVLHVVRQFHQQLERAGKWPLGESGLSEIL